MTAEILEFVPLEQHTSTEEEHCSFCGINKSDAVKKLLVRGTEGMVCATCLCIMTGMLAEDDGGSVA